MVFRRMLRFLNLNHVGHFIRHATSADAILYKYALMYTTQPQPTNTRLMPLQASVDAAS